LQRKRANRWVASLVRDIRAGRRRAPDDTAAHAIALHRDPGGKLLDERIAAVELLNVLRPTVAVSVYIVFVAHALHTQREAREQLHRGAPDDVERFVQEVRRFYPFFPAVAARVREDFEWRGYRFPQGRRVMLDLHG